MIEKSGCGFSRHFEWADTHEVFVIVPPSEVTFTFEMHTTGCGRVVLTGPRLKQPPGRLVARRDSGVYVADITTYRAFENGIQHAGRQTLAARFASNGNLPYKQGVRLTRGDVAGNETDKAFFALFITAHGGD